MRALEPGDPRSIGTEGRRYRVVARVGSGGMGVVYLGRSAGGRAVAIKVVHTELAENREFRDRFRREVVAARAVGGGFTAPVIDADPDAEIPWLVTEFLPSVSVGDAVQGSGALPVDSVWVLAAGVAEALLSIHNAGIVHGDVKPANVLLTADGPRVIDFGIARAVDATTVTHPESRAGAPGFMSPEQVAGAPSVPSGDIFSFGSTLAYACAGVEPFGEGPAHVKMFRIQWESPRLDGVTDDNLRTMIASCTDRDPSRRPTAGQLTEYLPSAARGGRLAGTSWLPPAVAAEIAGRAREAQNPPAVPGRELVEEPDQRKVSRRVLLFGAVGATTLAAGAGVSAAVWYGNRAEPTAATVTPTPKAPPSPRTPVAKPRALEFYFTGDVTLISLTYTVNGESTTLEDVELPWRKIVDVPPLPDQSTWRLAYQFPPGEVSYRVLVDGFQVAVGESAAAGAPSDSHAEGTV